MISDSVLISVISGSFTTMVAFLAFITARKNNTKIEESKKAVAEIHFLVDGKMSELLEVTKALAKAEGVTEGILQQKTEVKEDAKQENNIKADVHITAENVQVTQDSKGNTGDTGDTGDTGAKGEDFTTIVTLLIAVINQILHHR